MQITVQGVSTQTINKGGKSRPYSEAKVEFLNERGEPKSWTVRSFTNPSVFKTLSEATQGQQYEISTIKNDKDFTEWTSATLSSSDHRAPAASASKPSGGVQRSTYETPEERAVRQRLIVRQSSLAQAIEYLKYQGGNGTEDTAMQIADQFAEWVYKAPGLAEMEEDLPF